MQSEQDRLAVVLAASELVPAEPRDLSDLLLTGVDPCDLACGTTEVQPGTLADYLRATLSGERVAYWLKRLQSLPAGTRSLLVTDKRYPDILRQAYDHPPFLFVQGGLPQQLVLAIVGSRSADADHLGAAEEVARIAATHGIVVVSGLARGIDTAAHTAVLRAGGTTVAVVGHGIDLPIYPPENQDLATYVIDHGAVVSPFRPGAPATASSFVARNAVISGLANVSLVVAGRGQSGTQSEAEFAVKQGRPVALWRRGLEHEAWAKSLAMMPRVFWADNADQVIAAVLAADA
jgi:DNA processing protein